MPSVVAIDDLKPDQPQPQNPRSNDGSKSTPEPHYHHTDFFKKSRDRPDSPTAFLSTHTPGSIGSAHFHAVDEFQIMVDGKGKFGRHDVSPYCVHFSRAYTPYGPLQSDKETGWCFMTLRTRYDPGGQQFPAARDKLKQIPDRRPWQITKKVTFPAQSSGISLQDVPGITDDQGLFASSLSMAPHTRIAAPDPSRGNGQFVLVVKGGLVYDNKEHKAVTVVFIKPNEDAFQIHAGRQGLDALILNFPQVKPRAIDTRAPATAAGFKKWQCVLCSFAYDETQGMPDEGIPAGTRWEDVPDTWSCPDCSASKSDFQMVEV